MCMGPDLGKRFLLSLRQHLSVDLNINQIWFHCENLLSYNRARLTYIKEDDTVEWIEAMKPGSIVWDIGANIGAISLKAAHLGHKVVAFEPLPGNYYTLVKSINKNNFAKNITAYCVALYFESKVSVLNTTQDDIGAAHNVFDSETNNSGAKFKPLYRIPTLSITADEAVQRYKIEQPNYIKIDVDGNELDVLKGSKTVLESLDLQSVLIEITATNVDQTNQIFKLLSSHGFSAAQPPKFEVGNVIFTRIQPKMKL